MIWSPMRVAEELGVQLHLPTYQGRLALERFTGEDWHEALAQAQAGPELAEKVGKPTAALLARSCGR